MQTCAGAVRYVDIPSVIQVDIVGLNNAAPGGWIRNIIPRFPGMKRVRNVDHPQPCIEIGDIALVVDNAGWRREELNNDAPGRRLGLDQVVLFRMEGVDVDDAHCLLSLRSIRGTALDTR